MASGRVRAADVIPVGRVAPIVEWLEEYQCVGEFSLVHPKRAKRRVLPRAQDIELIESSFCEGWAEGRLRRRSFASDPATRIHGHHVENRRPGAWWGRPRLRAGSSPGTEGEGGLGVGRGEVGAAAVGAGAVASGGGRNRAG